MVLLFYIVLIDYKYNVRGWLKNINQDTNNDNDLFNFSLKYNDITDANKRLYNGNISQTSWNTLNTDTSSKTYTYSYDALNRILGATGVNGSNYNVSGITYDKNGNILTLKRNGHLNSSASSFGVMDDLVYSYHDNSNVLRRVADNSNKAYGFKDGAGSYAEYTYDANGNMKTDANKGITNIVYNHLNLPTQVTIGGQNITYTYDAAGMKLKKVVNGTTTEYAGNYMYENNVLQFFNHPEGYVKTSNGAFDYVYQYKDHLGNVRLSYTDSNNDGVITPSTEIIEESNYYPFGLKHKGYNNVISSLGNSTAQKFGYNGKEHNEELGLNWIDYGWRNHDPSLGRWMNIDNLSEKFYNYSPYTYTANNPIYYVDPDGQDIVIHYKDKDGKDQQHIYKYNSKYKGDNQFVKDVYTALNYIIDNDADTTGLIEKLSGDELGNVNILQNTKENNPHFDKEGGETYFNSNNNTVIWDPEIAVSQEQTSVLSWIMGDGYKNEAKVSPAEGLLHELGHAESSLENPNQHKVDSESPYGYGYDNREEYDVIINIENPAGRKLGRKTTRTAHRGKPYRTVSPTSVKPKKEKK